MSILGVMVTGQGEHAPTRGGGRQGSGAAGTPREGAVGTDLPTLIHELSNLLDAAGRQLGLVMRRGDTRADAGAEARLRSIKTALDEMTRLIRTVAVPRGCVGSRAGVRALSLGDAVRHAADLLRPLADARGVTIGVRIDPGAERCACGPGFAVVSNAVRNAIEAADPAGGGPGVRVEVRASLDEGGVVRIEVRDSGPGLPVDPKVRARLFEPGFSTRGGSGIGLAYARELIDEHGGRIALTDRADGTGAILAAEWPVRPRSTGAAWPRPSASIPRRRPRTDPSSQD